MGQETERFIDYVVFEGGGTFQDPSTSPVGFVNADLAPLYGLDPAGVRRGSRRRSISTRRRARGSSRASASFRRTRSRTGPRRFCAARSSRRTCCARPSARLRRAPSRRPCRRWRASPPTALRVDAQTSRHRVRRVPPHVHQPDRLRARGVRRDRPLSRRPSTEPTRRSTRTATVNLGSQTVGVNGAVELSNAIAASPDANKCYARTVGSGRLRAQPDQRGLLHVDDLTDKLTAGRLHRPQPHRRSDSSRIVPIPSRSFGGGTVNRRLFLRGAAGAALATPFLSSLGWKDAKARADRVPAQARDLLHQQRLPHEPLVPVGRERAPSPPNRCTGKTLEGARAVRWPSCSSRAASRCSRAGQRQVDGATYFDPHDQGMGSKLTCGADRPGRRPLGARRARSTTRWRAREPGHQEPARALGGQRVQRT